MDNKPRSKIVLDEFNIGYSYFSSRNKRFNHLGVASILERGEPCRSGRVVQQPYHFMVWEWSRRILKQVPVTTTKPSEIMISHFGKRTMNTGL